ncbi:NAD(P)/FAD-dependent oxidoreductase [Balneolales bacterium ANBcel1]|nr:NAD(P)/FAD-dependent oxidoreductase [Balneolales bacterium ANBcel1]
MTLQGSFDLAIIGAGPAGLLGAALAAGKGLRTLLIEKEPTANRHSRSIGIHPPSLEIFSRLDLLDPLLQEGVSIRKGLASEDGGNTLGELDFSTLPEPFNFILTIPQWKTEMILEQHLKQVGVHVLRGYRLTGLTLPEAPHCHLEITDSAGNRHHIEAGFALACDGKNSTTRNLLGIRFSGSSYRRRFAMADFTDHTGFGPHAIVFLCKEGLVESFPLPGNVRRWVAGQVRGQRTGSADELAAIIARRTGCRPDPQTCTMFSEFGVERYLAERLSRGRVMLAGDAAHVTSPIGGQGMNLGWMNMVDATDAIEQVLQGGLSAEDAGSQYDRIARKRAVKVIRRAEANMLLGSRTVFHTIRNGMVKMLLKSSVSEVLKRRFTMQGL